MTGVIKQYLMPIMKSRKRRSINKRTVGRERTVQILKMVALGALIIGMGGAPSPSAMNKILKELTLEGTRESRRYVSRKVRELKKRGYLAAHGVKFGVSDKGERVLSQAQLSNLRIPIPAHWNGKWHVILFDIPLPESSARKALDRILLDMGLVQYQQSVLVYPYPIKETVMHICRFYKISRYVSFVCATEIDGADKLKKHFKLL